MYRCGQPYWSIIPPYCPGCALCLSATNRAIKKAETETIGKLLELIKLKDERIEELKEQVWEDKKSICLVCLNCVCNETQSI